ncbi:MAG: Hsp20 family protein [Methanobacterium sp.]
MAIVESKEEMKKNMDNKGKVDEIKEGAAEKKEDIQKKAGEVKKGIKDKKEDITENIEQVKEGASKTKEEVKKKAGEVKEEATKQKEQLEKESEEEGRNPAEKVLSDLISNFRQRTGEINEAYGGSESKTKTPEKPLIDVLETNEDIIIIADISGVKKEDIDIGVSKTNITITTNFSDEVPFEDAKFLNKERSYGVQKRTIDLSTSIRSKEATAKFKKCTLTIKLPKIEKDVITKVEVD